MAGVFETCVVSCSIVEEFEASMIVVVVSCMGDVTVILGVDVLVLCIVVSPVVDNEDAGRSMLRLRLDADAEG